MAVRTSSSNRPNTAAQLSVVLGLLAVVAVPAGVGASRYVPSVPLLDGLEVGVPVALVLGLLAVRAARRGRRTILLTLGRCGGERAARIGRALAYVGVYVGLMGAIALAVYAVLRLYS